MSPEHGRIMTFIHQGADVVLAYRRLAKLVVNTHKHQYETLEETQHPQLRLSDKNQQRPPVTVDSTNSQPVVGTPREVSVGQVSQSQVETVHTKMKNPFAYVLVQVQDNNMVEIDDSKISLVKTMQKDDVLHKDMKNRVKMIYMREVIKTTKMDLKDHKQKYINAKLSACMNYSNPTLARSVRLPDDVFNRLTEVMKLDDAYEPIEFVKTFLNARNVSSETADNVLVNILSNVEPRVKPEEAITVNIYYFCAPQYRKKVGQADAITVGDSLEKSKHTVTAVKAMVEKGKKLKEEKLRAIGYKAEPIMEIIARELDPCIAFARASISTRLRNDGTNRQHCVLAFITFEDLKKEHGIDALTVPLEKNKDTPTFQFVVDHDADSSHVTELFTAADIHCEAVKKPVSCVQHKKGGELVNLINCIIIGGMSGKGWTSRELRSELIKYDCKSSIENYTMRKIMFNAYKATDKISKKNCLNSIFVHSPKSEAIMRIVANMAPHSIVTSAAGKDLEEFKNDLWNMQKSVVATGKTFPPKTSKGKKGGQEDDDDDGNDDVTYDGNGEESMESIAREGDGGDEDIQGAEGEEAGNNITMGGGEEEE